MRVVENYVLEGGRRVEGPSKEEERRVLRRAAVLNAQDRLLVEMLVKSFSRRRIAGILKVPVGTVCRRAQKLGRRLHDPLVVALFDEKGPLAAEDPPIGVEHLLVGLSAR